MAIKIKQSPGVIIKELDKSAYDTTDYSLVNSPVSLVFGFANVGPDYELKAINSIENFLRTYGYPTTEFEKYFYNAAINILQSGGKLLACKLPYDNIASKHYPYASYDISAVTLKSTGTQTGANQGIKSHIGKKLYAAGYENLIEISNDTLKSNGFMSADQYDQLLTNNTSTLKKNSLCIVDISKNRYNTTQQNTVTTKCNNFDKHSNDCLGIVPVIITPFNAMYYQDVFDFKPTTDTETININNACKTISKIILPAFENVSINMTEFEQSLDVPLNSTNKYDYTISRVLATEYFPYIDTTNIDNKLDSKYLKQISIVVLRLFRDTSNGSTINFEVVESFTGSLRKNTKDTVTKQSLFIDDVVNTQSQYINVFSNIDTDILDSSEFVYTTNQQASSLGFYDIQSTKTINYTKSIINPLQYIFDKYQDDNNAIVDIIVDAGISNIGGFISSYGDIGTDDTSWNGKTKQLCHAGWKHVLTKIDEFCKYTRKDCMFIADGFRPLCLEGNEKIVRLNKPERSVRKSILPNLSYLKVLNSSYTAGYCNWFQIVDELSNTPLWIPPSIKAIKSYILCDTYYHTWDAPAGLNRGIVNDVVDCAFNPTNVEAAQIYNINWNYAISYPLNGIVIEGQKTLQQADSAINRVNIRRLLIYLEKNVVRLARRFVYEGNTEYIRQRFIDTINPLFTNAVDGFGISDYILKCDADLNTQDVIDNNELRAVIAVRPIKTLEFIVLSFAVTSQSATIFEEIRNA